MLGLWFVVSLVRLSQFLIFGVTLSMKQAVWIQQGLWAVFKCHTLYQTLGIVRSEGNVIDIWTAPNGSMISYRYIITSDMILMSGIVGGYLFSFTSFILIF